MQLNLISKNSAPKKPDFCITYDFAPVLAAWRLVLSGTAEQLEIWEGTVSDLILGGGGGGTRQLFIILKIIGGGGHVPPAPWSLLSQ